MKHLRVSLLCLVAVVLACSSPGWAPTPTAESVPAATKPTVPDPTATNQVAEVTAYEALHVRANPGTDALRIAYLYHGDTVTLTGQCSNGWAEIEWDGGGAWVSAKYLSKNSCQKVTGD